MTANKRAFSIVVTEDKKLSINNVYLDVTVTACMFCSVGRPSGREHLKGCERIKKVRGSSTSFNCDKNELLLGIQSSFTDPRSSEQKAAND